MEKDLDEIEFPVLFRVCITPAFKMEKILEAGYSSLWYYFMGKSRFRLSPDLQTYGWAGHTENGTIISTPESILNEAVVDIKDVLSHVRLQFRGRVGISFYTRTSKNYVTASLRRPNYPSNCYDIDINKITQGNLKGFFQIQFNFRSVKDVKEVRIILEDKKKALSRTFKYNKFGMGGSSVFISDLTSKIYKYKQYN